MWWLNFNPQFNWPFSGSVVQDIHPSLLARAGNDETELRVLREVASYGRQIGVLSDLVLASRSGCRPVSSTTTPAMRSHSWRRWARGSRASSRANAELPGVKSR